MQREGLTVAVDALVQLDGQGAGGVRGWDNRGLRQTLGREIFVLEILHQIRNLNESVHATEGGGRERVIN